MEVPHTVQTYIDAWNTRDADAIVACFADGGTYEDPATGGPLSGAAIGEMARQLWASFPDLTFTLLGVAGSGPDTLAFEWRMAGTNHGPFAGLPPTGKPIAIDGVDFVRLDPDGRIRSLRGHFDGGSVPRQLGLQVLVQPHAVGPFRFGMSASVQSGKTVKPGAFSITQIVNVTDEEIARTRDFSRAVMVEMTRMEGFIGVLTARIGDRGVTIAAWEDPENPKQLLHGGAHAEAMRAFFADFGGSAYTSVWTPERINPTWVACDACGKVRAIERENGICPCGAALPQPAPYF